MFDEEKTKIHYLCAKIKNLYKNYDRVFEFWNDTNEWNIGLKLKGDLPIL